jgi:hypothetical protein
LFSPQHPRFQWPPDPDKREIRGYEIERSFRQGARPDEEAIPAPKAANLLVVPSKQDKLVINEPPTTPAEALVAPTITSYEVIDAGELARRMCVPKSWIQEQSRSRTTSDPIPFSKYGKYVRFHFGSPLLEAWFQRQRRGSTQL